jgi:hypothetical protein
MIDSMTKEQGDTKSERRIVWKFLTQSGGVSFICIGGATVIGNTIDRLSHTGVLFGLIGATIGLGIALGYIYFNFRYINSR